MTQNPEILISLGKEVKDEYGRPIGKIASFQTSPHGQINNVFIQRHDGEIVRYPVEQLKFDGSDVATLISSIKTKGNRLCDEIPLIWRKDQALKELLEKNKVPQELYEDLHRGFEGALNQLKSEAQGIIEKIDTQISKCESQIHDLNSALINLEIEREIGKVNEEQYNTAMEIIQQSLKWVNSEKSDLENLKNRLSNILLGENISEPSEERKETERPQEEIAKSEAEGTEETTSEEKPSETSSLPEPPVVVYVKNIDKLNPNP
ncbi:hypothetical protein DRO54_11150 [Candidatus Bathyarchaeota archaeon]|nr:MAG: hypothetical protein DRO54_11150 [Candidatus Bathyarchaeota archaeon]